MLDNLRERVEVYAPVIIEITDDIVATAGAELEFGSPDGWRCQPMRPYFTVAGAELDNIIVVGH